MKKISFEESMKQLLQALANEPFFGGEAAVFKLNEKDEKEYLLVVKEQFDN